MNRPAPSVIASDDRALREHLDAGLAAMDPTIGAALDEAVRVRLIAFIGLLARWSRAYNLTAVRDPMEMVPRHLLDSLAVLPWVEEGPVLDLGTGAGLPGIPLALARPEIGFTLLDSNGKKTRFVRQAVAELGLDHVEVVQARAETYRPARKFATIVARAVASLAALRDTSAHLAAAGGRLLALKGRLPTNEMDTLAADLCGTDAARIKAHRLTVPFLDGERNLIEIPFDTKPHG